jgi:predicted O-methyltransferase YrrM
MNKEKNNNKTIDSEPNTKWKYELDSVKKYMNNDFLYSLWENYKFPNIKLNGKDIELDSNINVYEACFISLLIEIYLQQYKPIINDKTLNFMEVGLAYGTSTITIINKIISSKYKHRINYDIIDMNQTEEWKDIGMKNISNFIEQKATVDKQKKKINIELFQNSSTIIIPKFKKKYDISFIDGSHAEDIVIQDLINTHKLLKMHGLIIVDDVLHNGVKKALIRFYDPKIYKIIYINKMGTEFVKSNYLYDNKRIKRNIFNPNSMLCLQKISNDVPNIYASIISNSSSIVPTNTSINIHNNHNKNKNIKKYRMQQKNTKHKTHTHTKHKTHKNIKHVKKKLKYII